MLILFSVYSVSCFADVDRILPKLPAPYKRLSRSDLEDVVTVTPVSDRWRLSSDGLGIYFFL